MLKKGPQNRVILHFFLTILSFPKNSVKRKFFRFMTFRHRPHVWQVLVLESSTKMFLTYQIAGFFKVQYLLSFCLQINIRVSYKLVLLLLVSVVRHAHNKFAISLYCFKKELRDKYFFA